MTFARLSADGSTVIHESDNWQGRFPVTDLPRWIAFYKRLRDRKGGRYRASYADDVAALEAIRRRLSAAQNRNDRETERTT
ncbi:hypothetical protein [Tropicimonas isoalkanivorans]|uniref:Uncharacterized protein n=1 Tax=Tropicimonas isoalkanivorans TaxID=441112 RepID=A0A1I1JAP9_9RHOB|nr:hypothetical protein [Tropicimonas isoalkanivorans]SFC45536.1 hypothetical protein SAMN04488094_10540 [Tropicimonas isoalkanivorans]